MILSRSLGALSSIMRPTTTPALQLWLRLMDGARKRSYNVAFAALVISLILLLRPLFLAHNQRYLNKHLRYMRNRSRTAQSSCGSFGALLASFITLFSIF